MVMLWASEDELVKSIVTLPAFAVRELLVNFRAPDGSAASLILLPPPLLAAELDVVLDEAGAAADDVVVLLLEPPHAANPIARAAMVRARAGILGKWFPLGQGRSWRPFGTIATSPWERHRSIKTLPHARNFPRTGAPPSGETFTEP
jgi:hypothetical protein